MEVEEYQHKYGSGLQSAKTIDVGIGFLNERSLLLARERFTPEKLPPRSQHWIHSPRPPGERQKGKGLVPSIEAASTGWLVDLGRV